MKKALEKLRSDIDEDIRYMKWVVSEIKAGYDDSAIDKLELWIDERQKDYDEVFK